MDSAFPHPPVDPALTVIPHVANFEEHTKTQVREMVLWSMFDSMRIIDTWVVPTTYQVCKAFIYKIRLGVIPVLRHCLMNYDVVHALM